MKMRLGLLVLSLVALSVTAHAAPATPEEVLKGKGLTRVGVAYLLDEDIKLPERLRLMRAAKFRVDDNASKRMKLEREIESAKGRYLECGRELADTHAALPEAKKAGAYKYNELAAKGNGLISEREQLAHFLEAKEKELSKLGDPSDDYINALVSAADKMEAVSKQYEALAADEEVKAGLASINQRPGPKVRLGPSPQFNSELPGIRRLRETVRGSVIKLTVVPGGIPETNVVINGKLNVVMAVDTGASTMTMTSEVARKLGLKIDANTPVSKSYSADGKPTQTHVVMLDSVRVGQYTVENVRCVVYPPSVEGSNLLGGTFLRNFICRVDIGAKELHLTQVAGTPSLAPPVAAKTSVADPGMSAMEKQERAIREAQETYLNAVMAAKSEFLRDVAEEIKKAKDDPETLKRLEAAKKEAEQDMAVVNFRSNGKLVVQINAVDDWKDILPVKKGDVLEVTASGKWTPNVKVPNAMYGPEGTANGAYLQGKIGDKLYRINAGLTITAEADGILSMRMEDSIRSDNGGFVTVTIIQKAE
jgi:aspartyl protease family protein